MKKLEVKNITPDDYEALWRESGSGLDWHCLFVLPFWLRAVGKHLGSPGEPYILTVYDERQVIGVVPLALDGDTARFLGQPSVCDYQDIVVRDGCEKDVMQAVIEHLGDRGIGRMQLKTLRPDAVVLRALKALETADDLSGIAGIALSPDDVTYEADLPGTWDEYLQQLNGKQRHEVRRKLRRLEAVGPVTFDLAEKNGRLSQAQDIFFDLFRRNRPDKADFMNHTMEGYFRDLIRSLAEHKLLRLYIMEVDHQSAAAVLCFDYKGVRYLYNNGYDERFNDLSVGVLCKVLSIRKGIETGCRHYDFLKGAEIYKKRIGGREIPLYCCDLETNRKA